LANYRELYGRPDDYNDQLRALEKFRDGNANDPAARFLLGYHYFYLGRLQDAFNQLDKAIQIQPQDPFARTLRNMAAEKVGQPKVPDQPPSNPGAPGPNALPSPLGTPS
jgi:tetratricopeptide (TPR) repeat protein